VKQQLQKEVEKLQQQLQHTKTGIKWNYNSVYYYDQAQHCLLDLLDKEKLLQSEILARESKSQELAQATAQLSEMKRSDVEGYVGMRCAISL